MMNHHQRRGVHRTSSCVFDMQKTLTTVLFVASAYVLLVQTPSYERNLLSIELFSNASSIADEGHPPLFPVAFGGQIDDGIITPRKTAVSMTTDGIGHANSFQSWFPQPQQKVPVWNTTREVVRPTNDNTAIALIAMGRASTGWIAERCVRSIRSRGKFTGAILLLTDERGYGKYNDTLGSRPKVSVILGRSEDLHPIDVRDGKEIQYRQRKMVYKRFKTLTLSYLESGDAAGAGYLGATIRYVWYLDVDNLVTNPLSRLFDDYYHKIHADYRAALRRIGGDGDPAPSFSFVSMWRDPGHKFELWQSGQIMLDRQHSSGCEDAWRREIDTKSGEVVMDQPLFMNVVSNFTRYRCLVFELPGDGMHFDLLREPMLKQKDPKKFPTIVHITSGRVQSFDGDSQQSFVRRVLRMGDDDPNGDHGASSTNHERHRHREMTVPMSADGRRKHADDDT
jgi:hypothetical protein